MNMAVPKTLWKRAVDDDEDEEPPTKVVQWDDARVTNVSFLPLTKSAKPSKAALGFQAAYMKGTKCGLRGNWMAVPLRECIFSDQPSRMQTLTSPPTHAYSRMITSLPRFHQAVLREHCEDLL